MSESFALNWATMAVSLFNTIVTFWLGLTVLLNAERRTLGIWLAGGGLLLGSAFFLSHSAILGLGQMLYRADLWWRVGWIPVILAPYAWYVVMLWYTGFWEKSGGGLRRRHRPWFWTLSLANIAMLALFLVANPLPSLIQMLQLNISAAPAVMGMPILILFYPLYILSCIGLSLDALLRPGPTLRMMGDIARSRARPWLVAASVSLLLVGLFVSVIMIGALTSARNFSYNNQLTNIVGIADLLIASLIGAAVLLTGQAIVSYEVFTGKTLPRRGLERYWQRAIILAAGYSSLVSFSLTLRFPPIYSLLLSTGLMVGFYALLSWRSYLERERFIEQLRPFISSQQLYDRLVSGSDQTLTTDIQHPFQALCQEILGARSGVLAALGSLAPIFGPPLTYPEGEGFQSENLAEIGHALQNPNTLCHPLDPNEYGSLAWAIPLWSERGLSGVMLLGSKVDQTLYTQEEIEIARAAGERLIDIQASAEMAQRLITLQRRQMVESQVIDRQTRLILHDDVLPRLHTAILALSSLEVSSTEGRDEILDTLATTHSQISDLLHDMPAAIRSDVDRLGLLEALQKVSNHELKGAFDRVSWQISPEARQRAGELPSLTAEVVFYAVREAMRNAARHARDPHEAQPLELNIIVDWDHGLDVCVEDNGVGIIDSGRSHSGGGQGLALHSTMLAVVGGSLSMESAAGKSTRVLIKLPLQEQESSGQ